MTADVALAELPWPRSAAWCAVRLHDVRPAARLAGTVVLQSVTFLAPDEVLAADVESVALVPEAAGVLGFVRLFRGVDPGCTKLRIVVRGLAEPVERRIRMSLNLSLASCET